MILQSLASYYRRLADDPCSGVASPGFCEAKIQFALKLSPGGCLLDGGVVDLRQAEKGRLVPCLMLVPRATPRTSGVVANFLCDNSRYVFGADATGRPERNHECFEAFRILHREVRKGSDDIGLLAVERFLDKWDTAYVSELPFWEDLQQGGNIVFLLEASGHLGFVHDRPKARQAWLNYYQTIVGATRGQCLATGEEDVPIGRIHTPIKGVLGAQTSGAALISFDGQASMSYGKVQNLNAPVSEAAAFAYTTALNRLLRADSRQRLIIGDTTVVFWAERKCPAEDFLGAFFNPPREGDTGDTEHGMVFGVRSLPTASACKVRQVLMAARDGKPISAATRDMADPEARFFLLGLAPNAARLVVRFWEACSFGELLKRIGRHYRDAALEDQELPQAWRILRETAVQGERKNIPPLLSGGLMRAILTGGRYPLNLYCALLERIRADHDVNPTRVAMIKAILVRNFNMEVSMSLDPKCQDTAYRLGRLFAVLESLQYAAIRPQTTIKDRFFGSASATPANVFPTLLRNAQHHIGKVGWGDQAIQETLDTVGAFPANLDMPAQGRFTLGYYHQRKQTNDTSAARKAAKKAKE